jgi:hypothetical protein
MFKDTKSEHGSMSNDFLENESPTATLRTDATRQRWDMFHRAIAHAKQSNTAALQEAEAPAGKPKRSGPVLSIVR